MVISNASTAGRLRIIRRGGQAHCLVCRSWRGAVSIVDKFCRWETRRYASIAFGSKCSDRVARADVTLERLVIREQLLAQETPSAAD